MATQLIQDITTQFNQNEGEWNMDVGGWDYAVVQLVTPTASVSFETSNDSGDIEGISDGSAISATNFISVQGINLTTGTGVTSLAASGLVRFQGIGQYLRFDSAPGTSATKVLVRLYKIS